jgi:hypothetical protein
MSIDGPQPTQGAPKKKKEGKPVGCFLGLFFCSLFSFSFFLEAPCSVVGGLDRRSAPGSRRSRLSALGGLSASP